MPKKEIRVYKVKDPAEKFYVDKGKMFDLPMKLLFSGKSYLAGKTNLLTNLCLQDDKRLYRKNFKGDNIYIFTSHSHCNKIKTMIDELDIPPCNMMYGDFDDDLLDALLDNIEEEFEDEKKHSLIILDDMSFGGGLKSKTNGAIARLFCNGRHFGASVILTAQRYCDIPTTCRENATGAILFRCPERVLETIVADHNYMDKKDFVSLFRKLTSETKHSFMCVNYSNDAHEMYMNHHFQPVGKCGKPIGNGCSCHDSSSDKTSSDAVF